MRRRSRIGRRRLVSVTTVVLVGLLTSSRSASAQGNEVPYADAEVYFELNDTDGDLGIHASIDGVAWRDLVIEAPVNSVPLLDISVKGQLRRQGLTELFFESAEPTFDELSPDEFFGRFPEGLYEINGKDLTSRQLRSNTMVTHAMPAPPDRIRVNGLPLPEECDEGPRPRVLGTAPIVIEWDPVETTHEELGSPRGSEDIEVVLYQVVIEQDEITLGVDLEGELTSFAVPADLLASGETKVEILAREETHNQTASESCFIVR